jgi:adenylosuccinate lyase
MESRPVFRNLSPLDHRYYDANAEAFSKLSDHLSEDGLVRYCVRVEAALLREHLERTGDASPSTVARVDELEERVTADDVYAEEQITKHNIRALVRVIKRSVPVEIAHLVHVGATSVDILDTANSLRYRNALQHVVLPRLLHLETLLIELAEKHAGTLQIGRTHGQHGVPITFGFAVAEYVSRLGKSTEELLLRSNGLRGKIAGAVGAYNSISLLQPDPAEFERCVLNRLHIEPSDHSTQLVEPEYLLRLLLEMNTTFGILANLADDLRNLQRTEIDELREMFDSKQVGSSTMPQKRNPWNSEHVKSLWKAFAPRAMTFFMDQISEHQRDLTNSASGRFVVDFVAGFLAAVERLIRVVETLFVDSERMTQNAERTGAMVLSEAAYTLLAESGRKDAHEDLRAATLEAERRGVGLVTLLKENGELWRELDERLGAVGSNAERFFSSPSSYTGIAEEKAREIASRFRNVVSRIKEQIDAVR